MMRVLLTLVLTCLSLSTLASEWHQSKIKELRPLKDGNFALVFNESANNCQRMDKQHYVVAGLYGLTDGGVSRMYDLALVAAEQSKELKVFYNTDGGSCAIEEMYLSF